MKAVILAGGLGSRLSEETVLRPKPMVEVGDRPILWHIMQIFSVHGISEFIIALGYRGDMIKRHFLDFNAMDNDVTVDLGTQEVTIHDSGRLNWKVHLVDTGLHTETGGRLKRLEKWFEPDETFLLTYGDGVADIDVRSLVRFHKSHGKLATVTTVRSPSRFGRIAFEGDKIMEFFEKPEQGEGWINGGFFVLNPGVFEYIEGDGSVWERDSIPQLSREGELMGYRHPGFWSCMDTLKEKRMLDELWGSGNPPWRIWQ